MENPFDDIVPRITAAEKRAQQRAREEAQKEREEAERRKGAKKYVRAFSLPSSSGSISAGCRYRNIKLLSFDDDEGATEEAEPVVFKKRSIVPPDRMYHLISAHLVIELTSSSNSVIDSHEQTVPDIPIPLQRVHKQSDEQSSLAAKEAKVGS